MEFAVLQHSKMHGADVAKTGCNATKEDRYTTLIRISWHHTSQIHEIHSSTTVFLLSVGAPGINCFSHCGIVNRFDLHF
jgi:hypothetical protein